MDSAIIGFEHIQAFFMVVMCIFGFVAAASMFVAGVIKYWKYAHKQSDKNADDIEEFREYLKSDKERIERLENNQNDFKDQNKLMLLALRSLLNHEIDGNHTQHLIERRDDIDNYLVKHLGGTV